MNKKGKYIVIALGGTGQVIHRTDDKTEAIAAQKQWAYDQGFMRQAAGTYTHGKAAIVTVDEFVTVQDDLLSACALEGLKEGSKVMRKWRAAFKPVRVILPGAIRKTKLGKQILGLIEKIYEQQVAKRTALAKEHRWRYFTPELWVRDNNEGQDNCYFNGGVDQPNTPWLHNS